MNIELQMMVQTISPVRIQNVPDRLRQPQMCGGTNLLFLIFFS